MAPPTTSTPSAVGGATRTAPITTVPDHHDKQKKEQWPVQLYRFTECDGWQKQTGVAKTAAAPRKDCIVIPCLRQKFSLVSNSSSSSPASTNNNSNKNSSGGAEKTYVIRRDRCLLLVSRRRTRALVLQFPSLQDCLDFSDAFMALNPAAGEQQQQQEAEEATSSPPRPTEGAAAAAGLADQEEVVSYVARMLHDKDFLGFVHKIETYLSNTTDGTKLLESLAVGNNSNNNNNNSSNDYSNNNKRKLDDITK